MADGPARPLRPRALFGRASAAEREVPIARAPRYLASTSVVTPTPGGVAAADARLQLRSSRLGAQAMQPAEFRPVDRRGMGPQQDVARRHHRPLHLADVPVAA